jgi:hypothetical protein
MTKKMRRPGQLLVVALIFSSTIVAATQSQKVATPVVQDDPDFADFVKKATTKPEFLSPLVDHLPKKAGVPSPKDVLGYHVGTEKKLTYVADQQRYFRALEKALPGRVKTEVTGKTEEGRDVMVVFITSEANLKNLETNRQNTRKLADPRGLTEAQVRQLIAATKPHYHISAGLHSSETNPPAETASAVGLPSTRDKAVDVLSRHVRVFDSTGCCVVATRIESSSCSAVRRRSVGERK